MKKESETLYLGDAYCRHDADSKQWEFGTAALRLGLSVSNGQLLLFMLCAIFTLII